MDGSYFPYRSEPVRQALVLSLVLGVISLILLVFLPFLVLQVFVASFALGPLVWAILQLLRRRHGITLETDHVIIQRPISGLRRRIRYAHIQGIDLIHDKLLIVCAEPVAPDPTYQSLSLTQAQPKTEQRKMVIVQGIDQLDQLVEALKQRIVEKNATLTITRDVLLVWANRIKVRTIILVILGILASPLGCMMVFRTISSMIGR